MTNQQYNKYVEKRAERSPCITNCIKAYFVGGTICLIAELFSNLYLYLNFDKETSLVLASVSIIFLTAVFTGLGFFDKIAKFGGAGALVPISGFANSMVSPSIEAKSEGYITGTASKMFTIAGPVIVYGTFASIIYGIIYYFTL